jgi:hypothetical protein
MGKTHVMDEWKKPKKNSSVNKSQIQQQKTANYPAQLEGRVTAPGQIQYPANIGRHAAEDEKKLSPEE